MTDNENQEKQAQSETNSDAYSVGALYGSKSSPQETASSAEENSVGSLYSSQGTPQETAAPAETEAQETAETTETAAAETKVEETADEAPAEETAAPAEEEDATETTETAPVVTEETVSSTEVVPVEEAEAPAESKGMRNIPQVSGLLPALKGFISFFTVIRLPVGEREVQDMESKFYVAPLAGLFIGLAAFIFCMILSLCRFDMLAQSVLAIGFVFLFSKFLHFDGLADFGDGIICSSANREDHIRALKDSRVGAGGIGVALIVVLISIIMLNDFSEVLSIGFLLGNNHFWMISVAFAILGIEILVKNAQVVAAAFGEPGTGMAARQVECTDRFSMIVSTIITVVLLAIIGLIYFVLADGSWTGLPFRGYWIAIIIALGVLMSIATGYVMARFANKTFGFVNGDILGATNEIARAAILLVECLALGAFL